MPDAYGSDDEAAGHDWVDHQQRHHILLGSECGFDNAAYGSTAADAARNLGDDEAREVQLGVTFAEAHEQPRNLFGRGDSEVAHDTAMKNFWIIEIDQVAGNVFRGRLEQSSNLGTSIMRVEGQRDGHYVVIRTTEMIRGEYRSLEFSGYILGRRIVVSVDGLNTAKKRATGYISLWKQQ